MSPEPWMFMHVRSHAVVGDSRSQIFISQFSIWFTHVSGVGGTTGLAIVEVYEVP